MSNTKYGDTYILAFELWYKLDWDKLTDRSFWEHMYDYLYPMLFEYDRPTLSGRSSMKTRNTGELLEMAMRVSRLYGGGLFSSETTMRACEYLTGEKPMYTPNNSMWDDWHG